MSRILRRLFSAPWEVLLPATVAARSLSAWSSSLSVIAPEFSRARREPEAHDAFPTPSMGSSWWWSVAAWSTRHGEDEPGDERGPHELPAQAQPRHDRGEVGLLRPHLFSWGPPPPQVRLLHRVLRLHDAAEHPERYGEEQGPVPVECLGGLHSTFAPTRSYRSASPRLLRIRRTGGPPRDTGSCPSLLPDLPARRGRPDCHGVGLREALGIKADPAYRLPVLLEVRRDLRRRRRLGQHLRRALGPHDVAAGLVRVEVQVHLRVRLDVPQLAGAWPGVDEEPLPVPVKPHGHRLRLAIRAHGGQPGDLLVPQAPLGPGARLAGGVEHGDDSSPRSPIVSPPA